jgi:hypothetical protein
VLFVACAQCLFRKRNEYANPFIDYFADASLLRHGEGFAPEINKNEGRGSKKGGLAAAKIEDKEKVGPTMERGSATDFVQQHKTKGTL